MKKIKILILSGDSTSNRGDRAILYGNIILLKNTFPNAEIKALSYKPERDKKWYKIDFFNRGSIKEKIKSYLWSDVIFWGGGELIQDDTSKVKIPYWFLSIFLLTKIFRKKVIALGQGLGPVNSKLNKILTKNIVNNLSLYFSRDNYSETILKSFGVSKPIISSFDPAILLSKEINPNKEKLNNFLKKKGFLVSKKEKLIGIGVRRWFHQRSSWIPHKYAYKFKLRKIPGEKQFTTMKESLAHILDYLVEKYNYKIVFFPMYTPEHEADDKVSKEILGLMKSKDKGYVIEGDFNPKDFLELISNCSLFFGIRLHSTILSTSVGVPSLTFYYVPKGKSYFQQLDIPENSFPIEDLLETSKIQIDLKQIDKVINNYPEYKKRTELGVNKMKRRLLEDAKTIKRYL